MPAIRTSGPVTTPICYREDWTLGPVRREVGRKLKTAVIQEAVRRQARMQEVSEANSGSAEVSGGILHYETAGRGDPIVLIHGNAGDRRHWDHPFAVLSAGHKVIRYDVRGFGLSSVPRQNHPYADYEDLRQLLDHLGIRRAHIAGWSMGSGIATDFALAYPERTKSLITVGPWVNGYSSPNVSSMFADFGSVVAALQKQGAGATKIVLAGTGHLSHMEKPDDFNTQVLAFLHSVSNSDK